MQENRIVADFKKFLTNDVKCAESDVKKIVIGSEPGVPDYAITPYDENGKPCGTGGFMWLYLDLNENEHTILEMFDFFKWCYSNKFEIMFSFDEGVKKIGSYDKT